MHYKDNAQGLMEMALPILRDEYQSLCLGDMVVVNPSFGENHHYELAYPEYNWHEATIHFGKSDTDESRGQIQMNIASGLVGNVSNRGYVYDWWHYAFGDASKQWHSTFQPAYFSLEVTGNVDYWTFTQPTDYYRYNVIVKDYQLSTSMPSKRDANVYMPAMVGWRNTTKDAVAMCCVHVRIHKDYENTFLTTCGISYATPLSYRYNDYTNFDIFHGSSSSTLIGGFSTDYIVNARQLIPYVHPYGSGVAVIKATTDDRAAYLDYFLISAKIMYKRDSSIPVLVGDKQDSCNSISMPAITIYGGSVPPVGNLSVVDSFVSIHTKA